MNERKGRKSVSGKQILSPPFSVPSFLKNLFDQGYTHIGMTRVKRGTDTRKGNSFHRGTGGIHLFTAYTMAHTRESSETVRQKRIQVSKPFYFSMCRAPLFFQGEESVSPRDQACSMRVDPSPFTPPPNP